MINKIDELAQEQGDNLAEELNQDDQAASRRGRHPKGCTCEAHETPEMPLEGSVEPAKTKIAESSVPTGRGVHIAFDMPIRYSCGMCQMDFGWGMLLASGDDETWSRLEQRARDHVREVHHDRDPRGRKGKEDNAKA